jgi:hypothetical protein
VACSAYAAAFGMGIAAFGCVSNRSGPA